MASDALPYRESNIRNLATVNAYIGMALALSDEGLVRRTRTGRAVLAADQKKEG